MKSSIGSHYSNDDDRHYRFARRSSPQWYPERRIDPDQIVLIVCAGIAVGIAAALIGGWL